MSFSKDSVEFGFLGTVEIVIFAEPEHDTENVKEHDILQPIWDSLPQRKITA